MGLISRVSSRTYRHSRTHFREKMDNLIQRQNIMRILCCECGIPIEPNPTNMCVACLKLSVDITSQIPRQGAINHCKGCGRWLANNSNANSWVDAQRESKELLAILLKKIKPTLSKSSRLIDASFIWTEPHSKRLKVKITIQEEVQHGAILEQSLVIEFTEAGGMCNDCHRMEAKDFWKCVVQVRQKRSHKKTFLYLEQLILKHQIHKNCVRITGAGDGLDFFFAEKQSSRKFLEFLQAVLPIKYSTSQKLISHDVHTSTYNYKYTTLVELPHVSKDDVICLPKSTSSKLGNIGPLVICLRVTQTIHLIDFTNLDHIELQKDAYWRNIFDPIADKMPLKEYMVVECEPITPPKTNGVKSKKHELADMWVIPVDKIGTGEENNIHTRTHLGHLFNPGDLCMAFDLSNSNVSELNFDLYKHKLGLENLPDVIIVKKSYGNIYKRHKRRNWEIKKLDIETPTENNNKKSHTNVEDELQFQNDLEEDDEIRKNVAIYKKKNFENEIDTEDDLADDVPEICLSEMINDLKLDDDMGQEE